MAVSTQQPIELKDSGLLKRQAYVDGKWIDANDRRTFPVHNPATGETIVEVANVGAEETRTAIEAAALAFPAWSGLIAKERFRRLRALSDLMMANQDDLAVIMTTEQGKPLAEAKTEIAYAASFFEWFGEEAKRVYGDTIPTYQADKRIVVLKQPVGVGAGITPWNFPSAMITRKLAPALAAGCPMVLKPAEQTPLSALALAVLAERAGIPPGVFSIVTGDADAAPTIGRELTSNPAVRKLSFTGSTEVGKVLAAQCVPTLKRVALELGGNAPFIVFDDADLDAAVEGALACKVRNMGQTCIAANRILVQDGIYRRFADRLADAMKALKVGSGLEAGTQIGPLIDDQGLEKVERHVADAVQRGAKVTIGGSRHHLGRTFFEPTVLEEVNPEMAMSREETFGPVAGLTRFMTEEDGVRMANDTPFGLAAYFYAKDNARVWRVSEALEAGMIGVNTGLISSEVAPFGGVKESGIGREGSKYGIEEWLEIKYLSIGGIQPTT